MQQWGERILWGRRRTHFGSHLDRCFRDVESKVCWLSVGEEWEVKCFDGEMVGCVERSCYLRGDD